jgi:hypothetical protein
MNIFSNGELIFRAFLNSLLFVWLVEPYVRLQTKTETKPILEINVGANLMFALLTAIVCEPMTEGKRF